jgi:8-oxo-dGTP diphosphatase
MLHDAPRANDDELVDADGLTEKEFLAAYEQKDYPRPSLTADMAVFRPVGDDVASYDGDLEPIADGADAVRGGSNLAGVTGFEVLMIRRGGHPFLGCWALPGGFSEPGEDCSQTAVRELQEETGLSGIPLELFGLYSMPGRDPRGWTASGAYLAVVPEGTQAAAGDDAAAAQWLRVWLRESDERGVFELRLISHSPEEAAASSVEAADLDGEPAVWFKALPGVFGHPRAQVVKARGFAFDHGRIVADAALCLLDFLDE